MSANPPVPSTPAPASYVPPAAPNQTPRAAPEPAGLSERDAASQIEDLFRKKREPASERGEDGKFKKAAQADAQPADDPADAPDGDEEQDDDAQASAASDDPADEPAAGEQVDAAGDDDGDDLEETEFEHKGKKYKVPKPLVDGAMRQSDYTQKLETVTQREKQVQAQAHLVESRQAIMSELAPAIAQVQNTRQQIDQLRGSMPDPDNDPIGYIKFDKHIRDLEVGLDQLQQAVANRGTELAAQEQSARAELMRQGYAVVAKAIPKWSDASYRKQVGEFAISQGYSQEELSTLTDPRHIALLNDAMLYRKVREARSSMQKKLQTAPPIVRPGGTTSQAGTDKARAQEAISRVRRTGNQNDAQSALLALLKGAKRKG